MRSTKVNKDPDRLYALINPPLILSKSMERAIALAGKLSMENLDNAIEGKPMRHNLFARHDHHKSITHQVWFNWSLNWNVVGEHCIGKGVTAQFFRPRPDAVDYFEAVGGFASKEEIEKKQ